MQEVATGKYHGHSSGGLNGVPPTDEIRPSVLSIPRTDANITLFVAMPLVSHWHIATRRQVAIAVALRVTTDMGQRARNDVIDPERHFATLNCRTAKDSFDHLVGGGE
jgi:hypothetical protein